MEFTASGLLACLSFDVFLCWHACPQKSWLEQCAQGMRQRLVHFPASSPAIRRSSEKNFEAIAILIDRQLHSEFSTRATLDLPPDTIPIPAHRHILAQHVPPRSAEGRSSFLL